jgi:uncharacterized membrane protein YdbT with pleckstrin-like domain
MNRTTSKLLATMFAVVAFTSGTFAQSSAPAWLEETMFSSGKINAVVAVVAVIMIGLVSWLIRMDRRLARMERAHDKGERG